MKEQRSAPVQTPPTAKAAPEPDLADYGSNAAAQAGLAQAVPPDETSWLDQLGAGLDSLKSEASSQLDGLRAKGEGLVEQGAGLVDQARQAVFGPESSEGVAPGSVAMSGAAAASEVAYDGSYTPALIGELEGNGGDLEAAMRAIADRELTVANAATQPSHHPTLVRMGDTRAAQDEGGKKVATYVANHDYDWVGEGGANMDLPGPLGETTKLASTLGSSGFANTIHEDLDANQIEAAYMATLTDIKAGDEVLLYFSGHGDPAGLVGRSWTPEAPDIVDYSYVSSMLSWGMSQGVHVRMIIDACHSGAGTQLVREEHANALAEGGTSKVGGLYLQGYQHINGYRTQLAEYLDARNASVGEVKSKLAEHRALKPDKATDPDAWRVWEETRQQIRAELDAITVTWDAAADAIWAGMIFTLRGAAVLLREDWPLVQIADYGTLGAQLDYIQTLLDAAARGAE